MSLDLSRFAGRVRVTDGAWGTELQRRGLAAGTPPELWNVENPCPVQEVARAYAEAGSDVILTNTFGANRFVLAPHGAAARAGELAEAGATCSRQAARGTDARVFGSIGPTGKIVMLGDVPSDDLGAAFAETARALRDGGVDGIVLETFNELAEAALALKAARDAVDLPVIVCMTFASGPDSTATMMGETPGDLARMADANGAHGVGANCGCGPANYVKVARLLREATALPIWIKPNAGLPQLAPDGKTVFPMGPQELASHVPGLVEAGANFIGGCCGAGPEHIRAIRTAVDALPN